MSENILKLEKRGCNFWNNSIESQISNVGNYRVTTVDYIELKDGRMMFFEFTSCDKYEYRKYNKKTGKPLKKVIRELRRKCDLHMSTEYNTENGCYRDSKMEEEIYNQDYEYSLECILHVVNKYSKIQYDKIEFVER